MKNRDYESIVRHGFEVLVLIPIAYLFVTGLIWITMFPEMPLFDTHVIVKQSPVKGIIMLAVFLLAMYLYSMLLSKVFNRINMNIVAIALTVFVMITALYWVLTVESFPWADPGTCYGLAYNYNNGDFSGSEPGTYIAFWPHQLGLITIWRVLLFAFGKEYISLRFIYAPLIGLLFYSGYKVTEYISNQNMIASFLYFWIFITCIPIFGYTIVPYGDLPSIALIMFASWMYVECMKKMSWWKAIFAFLALLVSFLYRNNSLIFFIGIAIVIGIKIIKDKKKVLILLGVLLTSLIVAKYSMPLMYHNYVSEEWKVPHSAWIAMGLEYETRGWWNAYPMQLMSDADNDTKLADTMAKKRLSEELEFYKDNPRKFFVFLNDKIQIQWNAPDMQCFNNGPIEFKSNNIMPFLYEHIGTLNVLRYMDVSQLYIYFGALVFIVCGFIDKKRDFLKYILLVGVFGGFLFTLFWEAKSRYVFEYYIALMPYASAGVALLVGFTHGKIKLFIKNIKDKKKDK